LVVEELSKACGGIALVLAATALGTFPIILFGTPEQKKKWLPDLASGKRLGAFAITEPEAGSDATATKCTAKKDGDFYILNGVKNFCSNGESAEIYSIFATTDPKRGAGAFRLFRGGERERKGSPSERKKPKWASVPAPRTNSCLTIAVCPPPTCWGKKGLAFLWPRPRSIFRGPVWRPKRWGSARAP
jgi:alkylation response protein AidB-like acyl-CoA dehydrogenase